MSIDRAVELATDRLHDQCWGTEDAPEYTRHPVVRFLEDTPGLTNDAPEYLLLGGDKPVYEARIGEMWALVNAIAEEYPASEGARSIHSLHARLGALVMESVRAAAEEA